MTKKTPPWAEVSPEQEERYKKMTKEEVGRLTGMERERARYHTGYSFGKATVVLEAKNDPPKISPFPPDGCMID